MSPYYNQIYTDRDGGFYLTMFLAESPVSGEKVVVYYDTVDKSKVFHLPEKTFSEKFTLHDPFLTGGVKGESEEF